MITVTTPIAPIFTTQSGQGATQWAPGAPVSPPMEHQSGERVLMDALDEMGHGLVLLNPAQQVSYCNHLARRELALGRWLSLRGQALVAHSQEMQVRLRLGVTAALRGQRRLVHLVRDGHTLWLACIPLGRDTQGDPEQVLLSLSREQRQDNLSVLMYARQHGLSHSEEAVLCALYEGLEVSSIARKNGVAISTVRSQVKSLRQKTGVASVQMLLHVLNGLPTVLPVLRGPATVGHNAPDGMSA